MTPEPPTIAHLKGLGLGRLGHLTVESNSLSCKDLNLRTKSNEARLEEQHRCLRRLANLVCDSIRIARSSKGVPVKPAVSISSGSRARCRCLLIKFLGCWFVATIRCLEGELETLRARRSRGKNASALSKVRGDRRDRRIRSSCHTRGRRACRSEASTPKGIRDTRERASGPGICASTTGRVTDGAIEFAKRVSIEIISGGALLDTYFQSLGDAATDVAYQSLCIQCGDTVAHSLCSQSPVLCSNGHSVGPTIKFDDVVAAIPSPGIRAPKCPKCSTTMRLVQGKRGPFWGCSRWPACHSTLASGVSTATHANEAKLMARS